MKAIPRILRFMNNDQILAVFSTLLTRLECLDVCNTPLGENKDEILAFMNHVLPAFVAVISDASLAIMNSLAKIILERHNIVWVCKNRVGLALLTVLLSRAETLKQATGENNSDPDVVLWYISLTLGMKFTTLSLCHFRINLLLYFLKMSRLWMKSTSGNSCRPWPLVLAVLNISVFWSLKSGNSNSF